MDYKDKGSYRGGFALGFFLGLVGLVIALCLDKSNTKRGAAHGMLALIISSIVIGVCVTCLSILRIQGKFWFWIS